MAKPDFLCIGAQKSGTTWLDKMFNSHEGIWTPPVKELQYFNELYMPNTFKWTVSHRISHGEKAKVWALKNKSIDQSKVELCEHIAHGLISSEWYERIFDYAPKDSIKGEMTPEYSLLDEVYVKDVARKHPNLKIIFVMREPVDRAISGIKMRLKQEGFNDQTPKDVIGDFVTSAAMDWDVIERGNYQKIISTWSKNFGKENMLCLLATDLKENPAEVLISISKFFGIDESGFKADINEKVHVGKSYTIPSSALDSISKGQKGNREWFLDNKINFCLREKL